MKWLLSGASGIVCALIGLLLAGWIASLCVEWYHISSFEGGAGYYVVFLALGGAVAGFAIGSVTSILVMFANGGVGKAFGLSVGIVTGIAALALGLSWLFGDVPPTLDGDDLQVLVEVQCPPGWQPTRKIRRGPNWMDLQSINARNTVRRSERARISWSEVREEGGRTILPGAMYLFTSSGKRGLELTLGEKSAVAFLMPLPGHPRKEHEQWSRWLPQTDDPSVAGGFRYRFRVMRYPLWHAADEARKEGLREAAKREFEALGENVPVREALRFLEDPNDYEYLIPRDVSQKAMDLARNNLEELASLTADADPAISGRAIYALHSQTSIPEFAVPPLRVAGQRIADDIGALQRTWDAEDPDEAAAAALSERFRHWLDIWDRLRDERGVVATAELDAVVKAAEAWQTHPEMEAIVSVAEVYRDRWQPATEPRN